MKVYLTGAFEHLDNHVGFGNASYHIYRTMKALGVDVRVKTLDSPRKYKADIEIAFDQPQRYAFMSQGYKIGYTPWESTGFMKDWWKPLYECNEIWTTSNWCKDVFQNNLPGKDIFVYQHGMDHNFSPKKRKLDPDQPLTFLFIGEPFVRKDGQSVAEIFAELYGNDANYRLIIKCTNVNTIQLDDERGRLRGAPDAVYNNIIVIRNMLSPAEMISLYDQSDVFVYPSWGEGFGFNPLQAMAMGIPTICTSEWADYKDLITVPIGSIPCLTPWPEIHPGNMLSPNKSELHQAMRVAKVNYREWSNIAYRNSLILHEEFDWMKVTKPAVERLEKIFKTL